MKIKMLRLEAWVMGRKEVVYPVLLQNEAKNYLVDCGFLESFEALQAALSNENLTIADLSGVIITHDDYDHLGGLSFLKQHCKDLKVYCGEHEMAAVSGTVVSERLQQAERLLPSTPEIYYQRSLEFIALLKSIARFEVDYALYDNSFFEKEILVVHTPGHTSGHISLFHVNQKILIAGDALVIENNEFELANPQYTLDINQALVSLKKILMLKPLQIICYHGGSTHEAIEEKLQRLIMRYE